MPITVAVDSSYEIVRSGLRAILEDFPDRVRVPSAPDARADVVVWSAFGNLRPSTFSDVLARHGADRLMVVCWDITPAVVQRTLDAGARGYVSTDATGEELVEAIERVHQGEIVVPSQTEDALIVSGVDSASRVLAQWPGIQLGLTEREGDVVALIARGLSNEDICKELFLGVNTVKTYIRTAYRKMGVTTRSQAVLWADTHGMRPEPLGSSSANAV